MSTFIRSAHVSDAELLPDIERSAGQSFLTIPDLAWLVNHDVMSVETHQKHIKAKTSWVADNPEEGLQGFLSAERFGNELHIWEVSVHADHQKQGIGRQLLEVVIDEAKQGGLKALTLTTFREVAWNEPFYAKLGFVTLTAGTIGRRLSAVLEDEMSHGLPGDQRCAMRYTLE